MSLSRKCYRKMEIIVPLGVLAMCLVLTLVARADTTHTADLQATAELGTGWVTPGHPDLGPCELDPPEPAGDESETIPLPAVADAERG